MRLYRIADGRHPVWSGSGAMLIGGRFNSPGRPVIYAALTYAGAMLEILVRTSIGRIPHTHVCVIAEVPDAVSVEKATVETLPEDWNASSSQSARLFGDQWLTEARSAVLLVPSVIAQQEWNALVNPTHPDAARIIVSKPQPVIWDKRLFVRP